MMNRYPRTDPWPTGILSACLMVLIAAAAAPAQAQTPQAAAAEAEEVSASTGDEADDDDLLEPSNTGYVDDAIVGSKFRLRYDSATGAIKPDRAEFIYGKCTCFTTLFGQDGASPGPAENLDFEEFELTYERAFSRRFSLFAEIPFRSIDLTIPAGLVGPLNLGPNVSNSGLGDVRAGMKYALIADPDRWVTFQLRAYLASGDAERALGTDHASIEPGILYFNRLSERVTVSSELRWWHPLAGSSDPLTGGVFGLPRNESGSPIPDAGPNMMAGDDDDGPTNPPNAPAVRNSDYAGDVLRFGFGVSREGRGERITVSPVAELVGWYVVDGFSFNAVEGAQEADNDTILNLKLGARISGKGPGSVYVGYGFAMSHEDWYDGIFRFEYRLPLAAPKRHKAKMAAARAAEERAAADRAAAVRAAAEAEMKRAAAETAAAEAETRRQQAEAAAEAAAAQRAAAEEATRAAEARRQEAAAAAAAAATREAAAPDHRVSAAATPCLNLRPEPSLEVSRIACLEPGTAVTQLEKRGDWSRIRLAAGTRGWVVSRALEATGG